jgi:hypothetical protein
MQLVFHKYIKDENMIINDIVKWNKHKSNIQTHMQTSITIL